MRATVREVELADAYSEHGKTAYMANNNWRRTCSAQLAWIAKKANLDR